MKSKGGRSKTVSYKTITVRIPKPIEAEVLRLKEEFYANYVEPEPVHKDVTGLSPIEDLGFSRALTFKLRFRQINTVADLIQSHSTGRLNAFPDLGRVSLSQIEKRLSDCGDIPGQTTTSQRPKPNAQRPQL